MGKFYKLKVFKCCGKTLDSVTWNQWITSYSSKEGKLSFNNSIALSVCSYKLDTQIGQDELKMYNHIMR